MLMKHFLARVARKGLSPDLGRNLIAFSGGVDSSVVITLPNPIPHPYPL